MGSSSTGSDAAQPTDPSEGRSYPRPRNGLIGRLLQAITKDGAAPDETGTAAATRGPAGAAAVTAFHGIANLRRLRVDDVAIPKVDIVAVPLGIQRDDLVAVFRQHGFSRVPVYKGTLDHPQGLILFKDLALAHGFGATGRFSLRKLLRPVLYAPPSMPIGVLLQKMQKERVHMALVIDEYGGVDGLVTIEDLIETVIGEIDDEHDEVEDSLWKEEKPGVYLVQATAPLEAFEQAIGRRLRVTEDDEEADTLGGIVFLRSGRVPARGEIVTHEDGVVIEVVDADPRRIKRLRVRLPGSAPVEANAAAAGALPVAEAADAAAETPAPPPGEVPARTRAAG